MSANDTQIKTLLGAIEEKRKKLGTKPRMVLKTNGIFKVGDGYVTLNINTVNTITSCIDMVAIIVKDQSAYTEAAKLLDVKYEEPKYNGYTADDWIDDFKLKASIITWMAEDKKIKALESKLKDLRSEDLKTADALGDIAKDLDL